MKFPVAGMAAVCLAVGQAPFPPQTWLGAWTLDVGQSKIEGLSVESQTLKIEEHDGGIRIAARTVLSDGKSVPESFDLDPSRPETQLPGGITISFRQIDEHTFDVIVRAGNQEGSNHFVFSADGKTLTETKVRAGSTSVLVFRRQ